MASKLYIGGLSYSTTERRPAESSSARAATSLSATVITDRFSGQSRGFGFVEMTTAEEAQNAISQLNGRELDGRRSRSRSPTRRLRAAVAAAAAGVRAAAVPGGGRPVAVAPAVVAAVAKVATPIAASP